MFPLLRALILVVVACIQGYGQESWGRRSFEASRMKVVVDERPAVFQISVRDWTTRERREGPATIYPTLRALRAAEPQFPKLIPSVAMLDAASKRFNDRLVAALDLLAERGWESGGLGKAGLLAGIQHQLTKRRDLPPGPVNEALARVMAARRLGGLAEEPAAPLRSRVQELIRDFDAQPYRSKPIGFYTWSPELSNIFRQDRFLQEVQDSSRPEGAWLAVAAKALVSDEKLEHAYRSLLTLSERTTNALDERSLLDLIREPSGKAAFLPSSRSHESGLLRKLYGNRLIPDGHVFMDDLVDAIRKRSITLAPSSTSSGWYDWQTLALESLARPEAAGESKKIERSSDYAKHCEEVFKAALTQRRETHVKQLTGPVESSPAGIWVCPSLTVEPQITVYRRTADSYRFVRLALEKLMSREVLAKERLFNPEGGSGETVGEGLAQMERRFRELAALSCSEIGGDPALVGDEVSEKDASTLAADARRRLADGIPDESVADDPRVMVPIGYDIVRKEVRCWAVVGIAARDLEVRYAKYPSVSVLDAAGKQVENDDARIIHDRAIVRIPYEVWIECSLKAPLNRQELRGVCDRCGTLAEIKTALGAVR